jgi:glycosyltransferase involved in cell wall biosynthesis
MRLRALSPDVVVCFGWASPAAFLTIPWCLWTGTPIIFYGDTSWRDTSKSARLWLRNAALSVVFRFAAGALSTGAFNREFYIYHGIHPRRIVDSVYPIDVASYAAARGQRRKSGFVIGFAGKLIARKGVDELLQALHLIANESSWEARVIGDGEESERLRVLATDLAIANRVEFRGFRNTSEMPSELASCDLVVVPSKHDNRGMIAAEAMSAGAAVIVSSNTGVWGRGDLVQDGLSGRVYRSGDPSELATIIKQLLHDPAALSSLQDEGARRATEHGPDSFTKALEQAAVATRHD